MVAFRCVCGGRGGGEEVVWLGCVGVGEEEEEEGGEGKGKGEMTG